MCTPRTLLCVVTVMSGSGLLQSHGLPQDSIGNVAGGVSIDMNNANNPSYTVNSNTFSRDGRCVQVISVAGRGVSDSFVVACDRIGNMNMLTTDTALMVGDPDSFCVFSDTLSTLVVIEDGACTRRSYTTTSGQTTSTSAPMTDDECRVVLQKMADEQEKNRKYWEEWSEDFVDEMTRMFPPGFPFNR